VNFTATYLLRSHVDILIIFLDEQQEDDIGGARSTHGGVEHFFLNILFEKPEGNNSLEDLFVDGGLTLK
jgi:hypothetical protein